MEDLWKSGFLFRGEFAKNKIDISESTANVGIVGAEAEVGEIVGSKMVSDGIETIIPCARAVRSVAQSAEI